MVKLETIQKYLNYLNELRELTIKDCHNVEVKRLAEKHGISSSVFFHLKDLNYFTKRDNGAITCNVIKFEPIHARKLVDATREYNQRHKMKKDHQNTCFDRDVNDTKKRLGFIKPTLNQVINYCRLRMNGVNPNKWYAHYESNGWKVGKNKMVDWQAAIRTWEKTDNIMKQDQALIDPIEKQEVIKHKTIGEFTDDELKDKLQKIINELSKRGYSGSIGLTKTIKF
jgi:hypothetical protein